MSQGFYEGCAFYGEESREHPFRWRVDHLLASQGFYCGDLIKKPKVGVVNSKILDVRFWKINEKLIL